MAAWRELTLRCPSCRRPLAVEPDAFACDGGHRYPVIAGVPRFVANEAYAASFGYEWKTHARTQLDSATGLHRSRDDFYTKTALTSADLVDRQVLDVGVGAGRFAEVAADAGARVVGIDITRAAEVAAENLRGRALIAQADLFALPFADHSFDVVYSLGVLHHTPDTRAAVDAIARLVKPGGTLIVWVYHPSRSYVFSDLYRRITTRLRKRTLYRLTCGMSMLYALHRVPILGRVLRIIVPISEEADPAWRRLDTFDWYSPTYQWKHRETEVVGWFRDLGFDEIRILHSPTAVRGRRPGDTKAPRLTAAGSG
jgi:ubiquinone/menaquinone biosynthesis C-methylase UbiE